jgi:hypothetical protein
MSWSRSGPRTTWRTFITLAQVDGARRDLLEAVTHGPRGDIVSVYTTFPWPALCEEVGKLKISLREEKLLDGSFGALATRFATSQRKARNRWRKVVTPSGLERVQDASKDHVDSQSPTENKPAPQAKKCLTTEDGSKVAKLALLAANAVRNADLHRALELIEQIRTTAARASKTSASNRLGVIR